MKDFFRQKKKLMIVVMMLLVMLCGCSSPRGQNGKTYIDSIIAVKEETVQKKNVDFRVDSPEAKEYGKLADNAEIKIPATTFGEAWSNGWFDGLLVYPIAQLINFVADKTDAGIGIIAATILIQLLIFAFSIKSQVASQRMQMIQPEAQKIQNKYAGKDDDRSKMAMAQEMQNLYSKYKINPFGTLIITFIQLPIILGMYQATMRAFSVVTGKFVGISLANTPLEGLSSGQIIYIVIFALMLLFQFLSMKVPQWLQKYDKKKNHVKEKKYLEKKDKGMMGNMNMMNYFMIIFIGIFAINWPLAMSFYWLVNSVVRVIQNLVVYKFFINKDNA